jgi:RNA polymerase sigma factor (sigma-70 family)
MTQELLPLANPSAVPATVTRPHSAERWALLVPHRDRLIRIARGKLADGHEAEDCVHDSLIRALGFADLESERVGAFLTTVVVRLCADRHRAHARARRTAPRLWVGGHAEFEEGVCDRILGAQLHAQLVDLSPRERDVLRARAEGYSVRETAERLQISLKAAESAFTRGRAKMLILADAA